MKPFNVRNFPVAMVYVCIDALRFLNELSPQKEEGEKSVFDRLAREFGALIVPKAETCHVMLDLQEADLLQAALKIYLDDGDLRPGSDKHKEGMGLYHGLCDYIATQMDTEFPKMMKTLVGGIQAVNDRLEKLADFVEGKKTDEDFQELVARKRDAIFGEIVGKPEEISVFGLPRVPEKDLPLKSLADKAVDDDLTGGKPVRFDMRNEMRKHAKTTRF